jgi:regulator of sigma E protease
MSALNVAIAIFGISLLVIVHESGHYLAARAFGMRVLRYSIGLGPPLWKYQPKGSPTTFQVCAIPLLAYVQIDGMNPTETIDPNDPGLYPNKGVFARIVTIFAGPFANYLTASILTFALALIGGLPKYERMHANSVGEVIEGRPADRAGIRVGDRIIRANGKRISGIKHLIGINTSRGLARTQYVVQRGDERIELMLRPQRDPESGRPILGISLGGQVVYRPATVGEAAFESLRIPWLITTRTFEAIGSLIKRRSTEDVQSVVAMTGQLAEAVDRGPREYAFLLIQLSVALGLFNLLPIPALDGGRLAFLGYELVTRRRANERVEAVVHTVGLLFLLGVLVLVMARDVMKLV